MSNRRDFLKAALLVASVLGATRAAAKTPAVGKKMIGIQVGAVFFVDESTEADLDIFQQNGMNHPFRPGAPGVMLSRTYSEMKLANLRAAGEAIRELRLP
jgi:hypothetical protein